jgi:hypothetical protein
MARALPHPRTSSRWQNLLAAFIGISLLVTLARWGGVPAQHQALFYAGVGALILVLVIFSFLAWYLFLKPLPKHQTITVTPLSVGVRQTIAILLILGNINMVVGGFWDEVWHRRYGVPFGEDFFWRPHLMMYAGLLIAMLLAAVSTLLLWRKGKGTLPQRFRANPSLGFLVLLGALLVYILPSDPLWHQFYGGDLSAWSLPHILLFISFAGISLVGIAILLTTLPKRTWRFPGFNFADVLMIVASAFTFLMTLQLFSTEWDGLSSIQAPNSSPFWQRPEWLFPVLILASALFFISVASEITKRVGTATLVVVLAIAARFCLIQIFDFDRATTYPWLLSLAPALAYDGWLLYRLRENKGSSSLLGYLIACLAFAVVSLPLMSLFYIYPRVNLQTLPAMVIFSTLAGLGFGWVGTRLGQYLAEENKGLEPLPARPVLTWLTPTALIALVGFIVAFIATATPPT